MSSSMRSMIVDRSGTHPTISLHPSMIRDLLAWTQVLAHTGAAAAPWESQRLRLRLLSCPAELV